MPEYGIVDLSSESPLEAARAEIRAGGAVDLAALRSQLEEIRDALGGMTEASRTSDGFGLQTLEVDLTIGAGGRVWFVAKGSLEASIKLTFGRPES